MIPNDCRTTWFFMTHITQNDCGPGYRTEINDIIKSHSFMIDDVILQSKIAIIVVDSEPTNVFNQFFSYGGNGFQQLSSISSYVH